MSTLPDGFFYENFSSSDEAPFSTPDSELQSFLPSNFAVATDMAQDGAKPSSTGDLVDRALLDKIDHLRRLDIGTPLPQVRWSSTIALNKLRSFLSFAFCSSLFS